jgi:putative phosphoribosyl transferase
LILDRFKQPIHLKFKNRVAAAITLSEILKDNIRKDDRKHTLVLGIPRAGVLTADIVGKRLSIPDFDIVISKKLTDPDNKEQAIGAVLDGGSAVILHDLVKTFQIPEDYLRSEIANQMQEIGRRKKYYRNLQKSFLNQKIKEHSIILLVDDGIATGATMTVTAKWIRQFDINSTDAQKRVIVAAPVAPQNIVEQIKRECSVEVATVFHPNDGSFHSVEQYHQNFEQVTDDQVIKIIGGKNNR